MLKLALDLDSTLCNFTDAWLQWIQFNFYPTMEYPNLNALSNKNITSYQWPVRAFGEKVRDFYIKDPLQTYREWVKPIKQSKEFVDWCDMFFDVHILTHSSTEGTNEAKTEFVKKHFGNIKVEFFDSLEDKYLHLKDSILVDDYPLHCILNTARNKQDSIIFDHRNEYGWSKLKDYCDIILKEKPNLNKIHITEDYFEVIKTLEILK